MTRKDKADFLIFISSCFAFPAEALFELLGEPETRVSLERAHVLLGIEPGFLLGAAGSENRQALLGALQDEYGRLFTDLQGETISLVESTYKPWTRDRACPLAFSGEMGLLRGDSALHLEQIFRELSLEVPEEFRGTPDHLALELEFFSFLYRAAAEEEIRIFIRDHLDWIPELKEKILAAAPHPFYREAVELLDIFLRQEREEGRVKAYGS